MKLREGGDPEVLVLIPCQPRRELAPLKGLKTEVV